MQRRCRPREWILFETGEVQVGPSLAAGLQAEAEEIL